MTREEEIDKAGLEWYSKIKKYDADVATAFLAGAKWADAHPNWTEIVKRMQEEITNDLRNDRWISVEDELPKINPNDSEWEYSDDVIVALKDGSIAVGRYERDNSTGEHYWMLYGVDKDLIVTHWMPLPQAPVLSNSEKTGKNHLIDANNMVDHFADASKMVEEGGEE